MYFFLYFDTIASSRVFAKKRRRKSKKRNYPVYTTFDYNGSVCKDFFFYTYLWWHCSFLTIKFVAVFFSLFMSEFFFSFFPPFAFFLVFFVSAFLKKWISLPSFPKLFKVLLSLIEQKYPHWFFSFFYLSSSFCFKVYDYLGSYYSFHPLAQPI